MAVTDNTPGHRPDIHSIKPADVFHLSWWIGGAVLLALFALFIRLLVTNENLQWSVVWQYLFSPEILAGLGRTLMLTFLAMIIGLIIGTVIAIMRLSRNPVFQAASWAWIWFFRGVPPLVQLVFWYNLGLLIPEISIGIPFGPTMWSASTNQLITPLSAALLGLSFTESAYAAEMIRAGIQAINVGQTEAAATLGMTQLQTLRRIVLPQAMRIIIPPIGNDTISMLKFTSLVSVLALPDLLYSAQMIYSRTYQTIPLLIVATIWYLVLSTILTVIEHYIEHRLKDGSPLDLQLIFKSLFRTKFWGLRRGEVLP
ncbi:amino acid ABC transporter permease [Rhizobium grahamii]|uniref:Glutamate/aspartate import permease protein GltK n=2 Tax=Rhizobium grahamii TaxID=1120045 RepID=S3HE26_9HYPH|nr:amino acid ABC transporter permease [Rhizobium grahamii]EPE96310.1 polar amino acid ABC transporter, inner membrane subunit [Rhizobium grahamii CCGE 502]RDJ02903.1 ABC transporter permease [Rhizobium grahamii]